ncbi:MAG: nitrous oxide-stimulated promoter family protein [Paludibacter sp.]
MTQIEYEQHIVYRMLLVFCRKHHGVNKNLLCESCNQLNNYAQIRLEKCSFGNDKPACKICPVHCYKPDMREQIREVMRYSGPRMALYYPIDAVKHIFRKHNKLKNKTQKAK